MPDTHFKSRSRLDRVFVALRWSFSAPGRRELAIALALSLPVPAIMAFSSTVRLNFDYHDVFVPLDAAWRTLQGQWPHSDFYTPIGLAYFWLHGAAAWLVGMDGRAVIWASLLALPFVILPGLALAWRRLGALAAVALIVLLTVLVAAPTFIDGPSLVIVHLANYNRIGAALDALVCLWALAAPLPLNRSRPGSLGEALMMGVVLLILLYLKVTFFGFAVAVAMVGCVTVKGFWRSAVPAGAVVALGAAALEALHPGLMAGYLHDIARAGAANGHLFRRFYVVRAILANAELGVLLAALAGLAAWLAPGRWIEVAGIVVVAGGCLLVSSQNFGAFSPSLVVLVMLLAQTVGPRLTARSDAPAAEWPLASVGAFAVLLASVPFITTQVAGTLGHVVLSRAQGVVVDDGRTRPLHDVMWYKQLFEPYDMPDDYTVADAVKWRPNLPPQTLSLILGDGFDLLRREGLAERRIANLNFSNPFPVGLGAPSPRGVALWWDPDRTFVQGKVTAEQIVGDAEVVMVPKLWLYYFVVTNLTDVTADLLRRDFVPHESQFWTAWVKRG